MEAFLDTLNQWHWLGFALLLFIIEVTLTGSGFLLWLGIGATLVGVLVWLLPSFAWQYQLLLFAAFSIVSSVLWRYYLHRNPIKSDQPTLNRRAEQYIGRVVTLDEAIVNHRGKVTLADTVWRVEGDDMPVGSKVKIVAVDGVILKVQIVE